MKNLFLLIMISCSLTKAEAQILATTAAGQKVILNMDKTWKFEDPSTPLQEPPCRQNHTGDLIIRNKTDYDIYFYYTHDGEYSVPKFIKIKAKSTAPINDLMYGYLTAFGGPGLIKVKGGNIEVYRYKWVASFELQQNGLPIANIQGISSGEFVINECDTVEVAVVN